MSSLPGAAKVRLRTLGGLSVEAEGRATDRIRISRRRLVLIAVLAATGQRGISRDALLALFWPESDTERARNALSQALFVLRRELPAGALAGGASDLTLDLSLVASDVSEFESSLDRGHIEEAVSLYAGPFLDGVFLRDAAEFERWLDAERSRLARRYEEAIERLAVDAEARGDAGRAVEWWRKLASADPFSSRIAIRLIRAHVAGGDRATALRHARVHETLVREELGVRPDPSLLAIVADLRNQNALASSETPALAAPAVEADREVIVLDRSLLAEMPPHPRPHTEPLRRPAAWRRLAPAALVAIVLAPVAWLAMREPALSNPQTIAVLPFRTIGEAPELAYMADGLTEELINTLAQLTDLEVIARTSAFRFREEPHDLSEVALRLGVDAVLTGALRRADSTLVVDARLVRVEDGLPLWAASYHRDTSAFIVVQQDIASDVAKALSHSRAGMAMLAPGSTRNAEAQALYLKGRYLWNKRQTQDVRRAIAHFERALDLDPAFGLAHAGIADSYLTLRTLGGVPADSALAIAMAAAKRALALDERVAAAHASLAYAHQLRREFRAAEREFTRALELNPSDASAHSGYAFLLLYEGRSRAALREIEHAHRLDPVSIGIGANLAWAYYFTRQYRNAIDAFKRVLALDPNAYAMSNGIGRAYQQLGMTSEAVASYREALVLSGGTSQGLATLGHALARTGARDSALAILGDLESRAESNAYAMALLCAGLEEADCAFRYLERAIRERAPNVLQISVEPLFDPIRPDPRFPELLRSIGYSS